MNLNSLLIRQGTAMRINTNMDIDCIYVCARSRVCVCVCVNTRTYIRSYLCVRVCFYKSLVVFIRVGNLSMCMCEVISFNQYNDMKVDQATPFLSGT